MEQTVGIREAVNRNARWAVPLAIVPLLVLVVVVMRSESGIEAKAKPLQVYFTDDGGKSFFTDDNTKFPPFDRNGKEAVEAFLFTCDGKKTSFVGYMMKYTPAGQQALYAAEANPQGDYTDALEKMKPQDILYRAPGSSEWLPSNDPRVAKIRRVTCPGSSELARAVLPGR
jgi:hypothetical protein